MEFARLESVDKELFSSSLTTYEITLHNVNGEFFHPDWKRAPNEWSAL